MSTFVLVNKNGSVGNRLLAKAEAEKQAADKGKMIAEVTIGKPIQVELSIHNKIAKFVNKFKFESSSYKGRFKQAWLDLDKVPETVKKLVEGLPASEHQNTKPAIYLTWDHHGQWSINNGFWSTNAASMSRGELREDQQVLLDTLSGK